MSRPRKTLPPAVPHANRRDTIILRSTVKYDPMAPRPTTPMMVGEYVVARRPLQGSVHTLYMIMDGADIVRTAISMPSAEDCRDAVNAHRRKQAASMASVAVQRAKKRRGRTQREEAVA